MATITIRPKTPDGNAIVGAVIYAELIDLDGQPIWAPSGAESIAGVTMATELPAGEYTLYVRPNTAQLADTRYLVTLKTSSRKLVVRIKVPQNANYNLEDVAVTDDDATPSTPPVTDGGVVFSEADKTKLDGIGVGAEQNVQANWTEQDSTKDDYIRNKPAINAQGDLTSVTTDTTLTGHGTLANPLKVAIPFTASDKTHLDGIEPGAQVNVQPDWQAGSTRSDSYIRNKPNIITRVRTDHTLLGDGVNDEMGVVNPFTDADEAKLDGVEPGAQVNVQANWTETDTTADSFIKNKPAINNQGTITSVQTDTTLRGHGTATDVLKVANPYTAADKTKLDGLPATAEENVQSNWNEASNTNDAYIKNKPDIQAIIAAEDKDSVVDVLASKAFTLVSDPNPGSVGSGNPGVGVVNLALSFVVDGTTYTVTYVFSETGGQKQLLVTITPGNHRNDLKKYHIQIGTDRVALGDAEYVEDASGDSYFWDDIDSIGNVGDTAVLGIYEPLDNKNFVPDNGADGDVLFRRNSTPTWSAPTDADINGFPTTADKVAAVVGEVLRLKSDKTGYELAAITSGGHAPTKHCLLYTSPSPRD